VRDSLAHIEQLMKPTLLAEQLRSFPSTEAGARPLVSAPAPAASSMTTTGKGTARVVEDGQPRIRRPERPSSVSSGSCPSP
jgi:hypothetical protein